MTLENLGWAKSNFRYFKIGRDDAYAYPDLLPGSIVRVNSATNGEILLGNADADADSDSEQILAVEHRFGVTCSHVKRSGRNKIMLCSKQLPYPPVEMSLGTEARLLGVVDLEIRRLALASAPVVSQNEEWLASESSGHSRDETTLGHYLRSARVRLKLSFQAASGLSREIARILEDPRYFCAASALSDIEAGNRLPRHIHKLISLSAIYGLSLAGLVDRAGLSFEAGGKEAMPIALGRGGMRTAPFTPSRFAQAVEERFLELPLFLHTALRSLTGLSQVSVRDIFWAGATSGVAHPYLRNAAFLAVNRRSKQPAPLLSSPIWAQPLYLIELRNGRLLCAACTLHGETLLICPRMTGSDGVMRLRNHSEAEILGKVVALVRTVGRFAPSGPMTPSGAAA